MAGGHQGYIGYQNNQGPYGPLAPASQGSNFMGYGPGQYQKGYPGQMQFNYGPSKMSYQNNNQQISNGYQGGQSQSGTSFHKETQGRHSDSYNDYGSSSQKNQSNYQNQMMNTGNGNLNSVKSDYF